MASIIVAGDNFIVASSKTLDDLKLIQKYQPDALKLLNSEGDVRFCIGVGSESINEYGISFNSSACDSSELACLTKKIPPNTENVEQFILDSVGFKFSMLEEIEANLDKILEDIKDKSNRIRDCINYVPCDGSIIKTGGVIID